MKGLEIIGAEARHISATQGDNVRNVEKFFQKPGNCARGHAEKCQGGVRLVLRNPVQAPERSGGSLVNIFVILVLIFLYYRVA